MATGPTENLGDWKIELRAAISSALATERASDSVADWNRAWSRATMILKRRGEEIVADLTRAGDIDRPVAEARARELDNLYSNLPRLHVESTRAEHLLWEYAERAADFIRDALVEVAAEQVAGEITGELLRSVTAECEALRAKLDEAEHEIESMQSIPAYRCGHVDAICEALKVLEEASARNQKRGNEADEEYAPLYYFARDLADEWHANITALRPQEERAKLDALAVRVLCGNCGRMYEGPREEAEHGIGKCDALAVPSEPCKWFQYDPNRDGLCRQCGRTRDKHMKVVPATSEHAGLVEELKEEAADLKRAHTRDPVYTSRCGHPACSATRYPCSWLQAAELHDRAAAALEARGGSDDTR